jgi:hypothetical protein
MMTVAEFCELHNACKEGREWAVANCHTMQEVWATAKPEWLIWVATRKGVLTEKEQRLFACWTVRQVWHLLTDQRSRTAVEVAEKFANGEATSQELAAAWAAAGAAARAAAGAAAGAAAWAAARAAVRAAAWAAAGAAAWDAAWDAAWAAAWAAAWDAAWDAAWAAQATYLRALTPNFEKME